jgi:hypothetical protein
MSQATELVTTAPESYDGFGTHTVEQLFYRSRATGQRYRVVAVRPDVADWQAARYASAKHAALPRAEFAVWVDLGLVELLS